MKMGDIPIDSILGRKLDGKLGKKFTGSSSVPRAKKRKQKSKSKSVFSELKDFEPFKLFSFQIEGALEAFETEFRVVNEGKIATVQRAKRTAIALFAVIQYGKDADGFNAIQQELGEEYIQQLLEIHIQLKGQKFLGDLFNEKGLKIATCASHQGMIEDEREYNSADAIKELAS